MPVPDFDSRKFWIDRWKRKPDASGAKPITYNAIQDRLIELMIEGFLKVKEKKVLDLGCGRGEILEWLVGVYGAIGTGIDIGIQPIIHLQNRKLVHAIQDDIRGFRSIDRYDIILSCFSLQHMVHQVDILAFHETILAHLASRGVIVLIENFMEGETVNAKFHPLEFYRKIWAELGLKQVDCRKLMQSTSTDDSKLVVTLKRRRLGWNQTSMQVASGEIDGKEKENLIFPIPSLPMLEPSEPSKDSSESTSLILPNGPSPDNQIKLVEDLSWRPVEEKDSILLSTTDSESL